MQNWLRLHHYPSELLNLVYKYYAAHGIAYICTYYHLDIPNSTSDTDTLDAGSYEIIGDLSGNTWEKITLLPIYDTELIQPMLVADERGVTKAEQVTTFNFPSIYGFTPTARDFVHFEELILNKNQQPSDTATYQVVHWDKAVNTYFTFYRVNLKVSWYTKEQLDSQVRDTYTFFDYEKQTYQIDTATCLYKLLEKNKQLQLDDYFRENFGFYVGT